MAGTRASSSPIRQYGTPAAAYELRRPLRARPARYERQKLGNQRDLADDENDYDYDEEEEGGEHGEEEDEVTRARFGIPLEKKRLTIAAHFVEALRRKRRMLRRSENLRFRELYRAPEPAAVAIAALLVAAVTLILTKSWPFY